MNWRRGILFASIHVLIAGGVLVWNESRFWQFIRTDRNRPVLLPNSDAGLGADFNPCEGGQYCWGPIPPDHKVLGFADFPVELISGGHEPCNLPTPLDQMVQMKFGKTHKSEVLILAILGVEIAALWFLLGAFPLSHPRRWWLEPGALITTCTPPIAALAFVPETIFPRNAIFLLAFIAWAYLFGVLVWHSFKWLRKLAARRAAHPAQ